MRLPREPSRLTLAYDEHIAPTVGGGTTNPVGLALRSSRPLRLAARFFPRVLVIVTILLLLLFGIAACQGRAIPLREGQFPLVERWRADVGSVIVAPPVIDNGKVIVRTAEQIHVLDLHSGSLRWEAPVPAEPFPSPMLVGHGLVVVGSLEGATAFEEGTGRLAWSVSTPDAGEPSARECGPIVPAAFGETTLYVVRYICDVLAYDFLTGQLLWRDGLPGARAAAGAFVDRDKVYLLISPDILQVRNSATGALESEYRGRIDWPASYAAGVLYGFERDGGGLVAVDGGTGTSRWSVPGVYAAETPLLVNDRLIVTPGELRAYAASTGQFLWRRELNSDSYQMPTPLGDTLYVRGVRSGRIYAILLEDGRVLGSLSTGSRITVGAAEESWRPVAGEGVLIVPLDKTVYAYGK